MPDPVTGIIVGGGSLLASSAQSRAARRAGDAQTYAAELSIEEQRAAREEARRLLQPFVNVIDPALTSLMGMAGLGDEMTQAQAIQQQEANPIFQGLVRQGENAILQNASATGGLRGGNVQGALAQFRPQLLNDFFNQQYNRVAGIAQAGQNAAAGVGTQGLQVANQIGQQFGNIGAAQAGAALGRGQAQANLFNLPANLLGMYMGGGGRF